MSRPLPRLVPGAAAPPLDLCRHLCNSGALIVGKDDNISSPVKIDYKETILTIHITNHNNKKDLRPPYKL